MSWVILVWVGRVGWCVVGFEGLAGIKNGGPKIVKNGPRVWAFCKIEFPGIQKPVQILAQKMGFFRNPGNRGVGVIWQVSVGVCRVVVGMVTSFSWCFVVLCVALCCGWLFLLLLDLGWYLGFAWRCGGYR